MRTCFRFRPTEDDVEVLIEGEDDWVSQWRAELGLSDIGWLERLGTGGSVDDESEEVSTGSVVATKPLPGPTPDPSKVVTVRRPIGDMNLGEEMVRLGFFKSESPTV